MLKFYNISNLLNLCSIINSVLFFSSVDEISNKIWEELDCENDIYLHRDFLKSIEQNHQKIKFYYLILLDNDQKAKAFATVQIVDFYIDAVNTSFENFLRKLKDIARKLHIFPNKKPLKLLISGNVFVSGEHGIFLKSNQNKKVVIKEIAKAILSLVKTKNLKIDAFLLKDFVNESLFITEELRDYNYHPFSVEPNMLMNINSNWSSFDDYLASLKTKFRVKAKKAFSLSKDLIIENITTANIEEKLPLMDALYKKVATKADFNLADFNVNTYRNLKHHFGENYILKTYTLNDNIVGFLSGIINKKTLDAHFVGIDYQRNREYGIYQRMLYNYIEIAIEKKLDTINFGRTASEIKSSVGAKPENLTMYLRHKKGLTNKILKLFLMQVQPTPFHQNFPFKQAINHENN